MPTSTLMIDDLKKLVGLKDPPYEMEIERGKVREFARSVYSNHPAYITGSNPIIPPTFLTVGEYAWGHLLERPEVTALSRIPFDLMETFDAEEEFIYYGPLPRAGDHLTVDKIIEEIKEKNSARSGKLIFIQFLSRFHNGSGRLVAEMRSNWVKTEIPSKQEVSNSVGIPASQFPERTSSPFSHIEQANWDELSEGQGPGPVSMEPLTLLEIVRYEGALGAFGPVHFDQATARAWGYPQVYSTGLMHSGALASYFTYWLGPENVRRFKTRFINIIWLGDHLVYEAIVKRKIAKGKEKYVDITLICTRDTGEILVRGEATISFNSPPD